MKSDQFLQDVQNTILEYSPRPILDQYGFIRTKNTKDVAKTTFIGEEAIESLSTLPFIGADHFAFGVESLPKIKGTPFIAKSPNGDNTVIITHFIKLKMTPTKKSWFKRLFR